MHSCSTVAQLMTAYSSNGRGTIVKLTHQAVREEYKHVFYFDRATGEYTVDAAEADLLLTGAVGRGCTSPCAHAQLHLLVAAPARRPPAWLLSALCLATLHPPCLAVHRPPLLAGSAYRDLPETAGFDAALFEEVLLKVYRVWVLGKKLAKCSVKDMRWTLGELALIDMQVGGGEAHSGRAAPSCPALPLPPCLPAWHCDSRLAPAFLMSAKRCLLACHQHADACLPSCSSHSPSHPTPSPPALPDAAHAEGRCAAGGGRPRAHSRARRAGGQVARGEGVRWRGRCKRVGAGAGGVVALAFASMRPAHLATH